MKNSSKLNLDIVYYQVERRDYNREDTHTYILTNIQPSLGNTLKKLMENIMLRFDLSVIYYINQNFGKIIQKF